MRQMFNKIHMKIKLFIDEGRSVSYNIGCQDCGGNPQVCEYSDLR